MLSTDEVLEGNPWAEEAVVPRSETPNSSKTWHPRLYERLSVVPEAQSKDFESCYLALAWYDFEPSGKFDEIQLKEGDLILVTNTKFTDGWWEGVNISTWSNTFPSLSAEFIKTSGIVPDDHPCRHEAKEFLMQWKSGNWEVLAGKKFGYFPASYVQIIAAEGEDEPPVPVQNVIEPPVQPNERSSSLHRRSAVPHRILQRFHPFVVSGAEEFILTGGESVPQEYKQAFSMLRNFSDVMPGLMMSALQTSYNTASSIRLPPPVNARGDSIRAVYHITDGPKWQVTEALPDCDIRVSNPLHRSQWGGLSEWTVYAVSHGTPDGRICIARRYSHFRLLQHYLTLKFPALLIPDLPAKQFNGRFRYDFVEKRMISLERWLRRIARHPVLAVSEGFSVFLHSGAWGADEEQGKQKYGVHPEQEKRYSHSETAFNECMRKLMESLSTEQATGVEFFCCVYHPAFNLPPEETFSETGFDDCRSLHSVASTRKFDPEVDMETMDIQKSFMKRLSKRAEGVQDALEKYRDLTLHGFRKELKRVSCALQRLVAFNVPLPTKTEECSEDDSSRRSSFDTSATTHTSPQRAGQPPVWCHLGSECRSCTHLTSALQAVAQTMSALATIQTDFSAECLAPMIEHVSDWVKMEGRWNYTLQIHEEAASMGKQMQKGTEDPLPGAPPHLSREHILSRLSTVLNTNHAEFEHWFHRERVVEWSEIMDKWVEGELARVEKWSMILQGCRSIVKRSINQAKSELDINSSFDNTDEIAENLELALSHQ